jgi:hypothetical protein
MMTKVPTEMNAFVTFAAKLVIDGTFIANNLDNCRVDLAVLADWY